MEKDKELLLCQKCKQKRIYDGDTYCLVTHRTTGAEIKTCLGCGIRYSESPNYEVTTLEMIKPVNNEEVGYEQIRHYGTICRT